MSSAKALMEVTGLSSISKLPVLLDKPVLSPFMESRSAHQSLTNHSALFSHNVNTNTKGWPKYSFKIYAVLSDEGFPW